MHNDQRLLAFALGTFHAFLLTFALVAGLYLTSNLGELLAGLNTAIGLSVFAAMWATSVYCALRGIRDAGLQPGDQSAPAAVLSNAVTWGAWNGVLFFWCLLGGGLLALLVLAIEEGSTDLGGVVVFAIVGFGLGTIFATFIGAFIGFLTALLDLALLEVARVIGGVSP